MLVKIKDLSIKQPCIIPNSSSIGYRCLFENELGHGQALFVPQSEELEDIPDRQIRVDTSFASMSNLQPLAPGRLPAYKLEQLETAGDFMSIGVLTGLIWLDDTYNDAMIEAMVGEIRCSFSAEGLEDLGLEYGEWVSFILHGLTLWEQLE